MPPQTSQDSTSQLDRTTEHNNQPQHQPQIQAQQQIQMPHQQQSGHFQSQQNQMAMSWRSGGVGGGTGGGGSSRHYSPKFQHHNLGSPSHRPNWSQGPSGSPRQTNNKQNRKPQGGKMRNDHYATHFTSSSHSQGQSMAHNAAASSPYYTMTGEQQPKGHGATEYYPTNTVMYNYPTGMPNVPHSTGPRVNYNYSRDT